MSDVQAGIKKMETGIMILLWQYLYVKVTGEIKVTLNTTYDCVQFL